MSAGMLEAMRGRPETTQTIFLVGESDDWLEAAFTSKDRADAYLAQRRDSDHWWIHAVPLNPGAKAS